MFVDLVISTATTGWDSNACTYLQPMQGEVNNSSNTYLVLLLQYIAIQYSVILYCIYWTQADLRIPNAFRDSITYCLLDGMVAVQFLATYQFR